MRMSVMGQGRARVGCCSVAGTDCSAPAAILDAFLRLEEKGIVKPGIGGGNGDLKSRSCALGIAPEVSQES